MFRLLEIEADWSSQSITMPISGSITANIFVIVQFPTSLHTNQVLEIHETINLPTRRLKQFPMQSSLFNCSILPPLTYTIQIEASMIAVLLTLFVIPILTLNYLRLAVFHTGMYRDYRQNSLQ